LAAVPSLTQNGSGAKIGTGKKLGSSATTDSKWLRCEDWCGKKELCHNGYVGQAPGSAQDAALPAQSDWVSISSPDYIRQSESSTPDFAH
jgi:hypothetical protein